MELAEQPLAAMFLRTNRGGHAMRKYLHLLFCLLVGLTLSACGGGGGGGDSDEEPVADVSGTWDITEIMGDNTCFELVGSRETYEVTVTMSGNDVTVQTPAGTFRGTIDGDELEWTGSYPEGGGTTTIEEMDLTVSSDGSRLSGTTRWRYSEPGFSCSGTTTVEGIRTSGPPGGGGGNACGTVIDISPNSTTMGTLEAGDCTGENLDPGSNDTTFVDEFRVTLSSGGTLTIRMDSTALDAFLFLIDSATSCANAACDAGQVIATNDDGGGGSNALISVPLNAGTYIILANSFFPGTGSYTIQTTFP